MRRQALSLVDLACGSEVMGDERIGGLHRIGFVTPVKGSLSVVETSTRCCGCVEGLMFCCTQLLPAV